MFWICAENSVDNTGTHTGVDSAHTGSRTFLLHQQVVWGYTRSWERTQLGQLTPTGQSNISYHMTMCSAYKAGEEGRGACLEWCYFVFPINHIIGWTAVLEMAKHLPANGKEWMNSLFTFACAHDLCFTCETVITSTQKFCLVPFWFYPPSKQWGVSEWAAV